MTSCYFDLINNRVYQDDYIEEKMSAQVGLFKAPSIKAKSQERQAQISLTFVGVGEHRTENPDRPEA